MTITRARKRRLTWRIAGDMLLSGYGLTFDLPYLRRRLRRWVAFDLLVMQVEAEDLSDVEKWAGYDAPAWDAVNIGCEAQAQRLVAHGLRPDDLGLPAVTGRRLCDEWYDGAITLGQLQNEVAAARERQAQDDAKGGR